MTEPVPLSDCKPLSLPKRWPNRWPNRWQDLRRLAVFAFLALLGIAAVTNPVGAGGAKAQETQSRANPEDASGTENKALALAKRHMVAAANPHATETGRKILRSGGAAIDAAIAMQMVLNLVEPQSSGIGGGAFLLHWRASGGELTSYDGRETAPAAATPDRFLEPDGEPMKFGAAVASGLSVGVPGLLRMLEKAHARHGKLPWAQLFEPAIALALEGFPVSPRLAGLLAWRGSDAFGAEARTYFFSANGRARPVGYLLKNPAFAETLRKIATGGADAFHQGEIADAIVSKVATGHSIPGGMTVADLNDYVAKERQAVCLGYREHRVCGMGPPSSGALTVGQILRLVEPFSLGVDGPTPDGVHLLAEAGKLAYADRDIYMADADFVAVPGGLLDPAYLAERRGQISPDAVMAKAEPGQPPDVNAKNFGADATVENPGTSHISVVDADGNAVSMTSSIEGAFGSGLMVGGFLLNNELTDFSFRPVDKDGRAIANRVEPGKRPRSSMAPTMVFAPDGSLKAVLGSPGGSRIILYVVKSVVGLIDWKLDAQSIAALPNFGSRGGAIEIEPRLDNTALAIALVAKGHLLKPVPMTSGIHMIVRRTDGTLEGGADPRREGIALGD